MPWCSRQRDPAGLNYLKNAFAEVEHVDFHNGLTKQSIFAADGTDITEKVEEALAWLTENSF